MLRLGVEVGAEEVREGVGGEGVEDERDLQAEAVVEYPNSKVDEIFSFADYTILVKVLHELIIFLVCEEEENYFVMEAVVNCVGKVLSQVTK